MCIKTMRTALSVIISMVILLGCTTVETRKDGKVIKQPVTTGVLDGWMLEVTDGLIPGDRVIVVGHRSVGEEQYVNVIRTVTDARELTR